jgi:hypothetical protein
VRLNLQEHGVTHIRAPMSTARQSERTGPAQDSRVVTAVKKTGRKKLVITALWTEMCLAQPPIHADG